MHDAFEPAPILEKLPLQIESIACFDNTLLVGTKQGHLLQYEVKPSDTSDRKFHVKLVKSNKTFSKKPISQLSAVQALFILISLSDSLISVHDLVTLTLITCLNRSKGASLFAVDLQNGETNSKLRMCVAAKKKLQILYWKNRDFHDLQEELTLYDVPRSLTWCNDSVCVGFKREYFLIKVNTGTSKELFPVGNNQQEPIVTALQGGKLVLGRDQLSIFIDADGNPTSKSPLTWSDIPIMLQHEPPYIIAILPKCVEIRTIEPRSFIQSVELSKAKLITRGGGHVYVASNDFVWRLAATPISEQIRQLLQNKEFELALCLANMTDDAGSEKERRLQHIQNLFAFNLFCQHKFEESLKIFSSLGTDPSHVIGLYPNLLPQDFRNKLEYPERLPDLEGGELEKGLLALVEYITQKRNEVLKDITKDMPSTAIVEGNTIIKSKKQLSLIIDTTLLKCYLQTNESLVASLLRLKDNNCHVEECERVLRKKGKYGEMIILYETKGLHKKALELLVEQAARPSSSLRGHDMTVQYLQRLGPDHLDLILEYSVWVLKSHPEDGLRIFIEDLPEVEQLPRGKVLDFLERTAGHLAIQYLEHVIFKCGDKNPEFHNCLVHAYREKVQGKMMDYLDSLPEGHSPPKAGAEPGELGEMRAKLLSFLDFSQSYIPERLLTHFPLEGFHEERAILLGRLGHHEQALGILVHILQDNNLALEYCRKHYDKSSAEHKKVYEHLLKTYLEPPDPSSLGLKSQYSFHLQPNIPAALLLLEEQPNKIDTAIALSLLPESTRVQDIWAYLEKVVEERAAYKRNCQLLRSLLYAENLQVHEERIFYEKRRCVITEEKVCHRCKKRIGNSAFVWNIDGTIIHYGCQTEVVWNL